jgi:integrase
VPLSERAVELLRAQLKISHSDFAFPAAKGGMLSDMTLTAVLRRMEVDAVPHGFRSTFRDWCAEQTDYPNEVAEMALAHAVGNKVEAAYRRGDLLEKRAQLMKDWAAFASVARKAS